MLVGIVVLTMLVIEPIASIKADPASKYRTGVLLPKAPQNRLAGICAIAKVLAVKAADVVGNPRFI